MLQKLGYSSKLPTEIRYGPEELGGLGLFDLQTELGISTLNYMSDAIFSHTEAAKLMILNVKYLQIESGISELLQAHPGIYIPYQMPTWITLVWQFLFQLDLPISLIDTIMIKFHGQYPKILCPMAMVRWNSATYIMKKLGISFVTKLEKQLHNSKIGETLNGEFEEMVSFVED